MIKFNRYIKFILLLLAVAIMMACGFGRSNNATQPTDPSAAKATDLVDGGEFNKFFPKNDGDFEVIFTQEKAGFAQATLKQSGGEVATLSVSDIAGDTDALAKFSSNTTQLAGYPATNSGSQGSVLLVADRFQVQVRSKTDTFAQTDRENWLQKFDLAGLSSLAPNK